MYQDFRKEKSIVRLTNSNYFLCFDVTKLKIILELIIYKSVFRINHKLTPSSLVRSNDHMELLVLESARSDRYFLKHGGLNRGLKQVPLLLESFEKTLQESTNILIWEFGSQIKSKSYFFSRNPLQKSSDLEKRSLKVQFCSF